MSLDIKILSVETDGDAPGETWLKERGYRTFTTDEICHHLLISFDTLGGDKLGFPLIDPKILPSHFVLAVPCLEGVYPHYWIYRFHPSSNAVALLFKLTHGGGV